MNPKNLFFLSGCLLCSCAAPAPKTVYLPPNPVTTGTVMDTQNQENVRSDEIVKTYSVGAEVDPQNPNIRHDPHNIERIESSALWDLRPNVPSAINMGPLVAMADPAQEKDHVPAELELELVKTKALNRAIVEQNEALAKQLEKFKDQVDNSKVMFDKFQDALKKLDDTKAALEQARKDKEAEKERKNTWSDYFNSFFGNTATNAPAR